MQSNSATAEESAAASEELSGQAELLKNQAGHFKLRESNQVTAQNNSGQYASDVKDTVASKEVDRYYNKY